jgi:predicted transcriptional regulator
MIKLTQNLTQKERFSIELKKINEDVTMADRSAFMEETHITASNLSQYLRGKVFDNDKAALIIKFFKARIAKREEVLQP